MALYLGIDTSNYTTSIAVYDTKDKKVIHKKKLLPVKPGERGVRQSDAVFHHTMQIRQLIDQLSEQLRESGRGCLGDVKAVGVSIRPRWSEDSYMPCFMVGQTIAHVLAETLCVPLYEFSHQEGHVAATIYSSGRFDLLEKNFLAFHVSGGTTDLLLVSRSERCPVSCEPLASSNDLKAGQAIDRVGVMMGLNFPCGAELEKLAMESKRQFNVRIPKLSDKGDCSISGLENQCKKMYDDREPYCDIALYCLRYIEKTIYTMAKSAALKYPGLAFVFSGGVMSDKIIRKSLIENFECVFAEPEFSSDNAAGISVLTSLKED